MRAMWQSASGLEGGSSRSRDRLLDLYESIVERMKSPSPRVKSVVGGGRVIKIESQPVDIWIVLGEASDYVVLPRAYCSCPHFIIRVLGQDYNTPCYHLVAVEYAKIAGRYTDLSDSLKPQQTLDIILEVMYGNRSRTLRKKLYKIRRKESL